MKDPRALLLPGFMNSLTIYAVFLGCSSHLAAARAV